MSNGKGNGSGVAHRALDQMVKLQTEIFTKLGTFEVEWTKRQNELINKHNEIVAKVVALETLVNNIASFSAGELGKLAGISSQNFRWLADSCMDSQSNVMALSEMTKQVVGHLTQVDVLIQKTSKGEPISLSGEDLDGIKASSEQWYQKLLNDAFAVVRTRMEAEEAARVAAQKSAEAAELRAKEEMEKTAANAAEAQAIETELKNAGISERTSISNKSGGQGSSFPEGAEIFGG